MISFRIEQLTPRREPGRANGGCLPEAETGPPRLREGRGLEVAVSKFALAQYR